MKKINLIVCLLILFFSCKSEENKINSNQDSDIETISILDTLQLKLDQGEKWIANVETHKGVKQMDSIISAFKKENKNDYVALGTILSKQTSYIIKNCSMKGEPHDQLHVVLVPMLDEISILREPTTSIESKEALVRLEQLILKYFEYFKVN
ncbi:hypothetical protein [Psychroserpens sp.]|uniref:hypothetical protein n=1 Tax=Psychroserpens sp. TaxID=2020870 RepID=UPI00385B12BB